MKFQLNEPSFKVNWIYLRKMSFRPGNEGIIKAFFCFFTGLFVQLKVRVDYLKTVT